MLDLLQSIQYRNIDFTRFAPVQKRKQAKLCVSVPDFNVKYSKNLNADTVCFKGSSIRDDGTVRELIERRKQRAEQDQVFSEEEIDEIESHVTKDNFPFLIDLLEIANRKLRSEDIIYLLDHIERKDTDKKEFREKVNTFKDLRSVLKSYTSIDSPIPEYLDLIPPQGVVDMLQFDTLLRDPTSDVQNSLPQAYKYAAKYFARRNESSGFSMNLFMESGLFSSIFALAQIYETTTLNEFFYNRNLYIEPIYMKRLRTLTKEDLKNLRDVQTSAVTDKENKGGDYATYEISLDDKIWTLNFLHVNREIKNEGEEGLNFRDYLMPTNSRLPDDVFKIDFQRMKVDLMDRILRHIGIPDDKVDEYTAAWQKAYAEDQSMKNHRKDFWDINYAHLLNAPEKSLLRKIIVADTLGKFDELLFGEGEIANINRRNEQAFRLNGLDYEKWLHPEIPPITKKFKDKSGRKIKTFTVKNWDRCAKESLLDGNYTTCCTGLDKHQGDSFPHYLTNTCTTTLEVRNEKNKVVAMSRLLMARINGKVSMVVENIEVNNKIAKHYLTDSESIYKFREMIFDYARAFAKEINKKHEDIPVYFSSKYYKVKGIEKGLELGDTYEDVDLIGDFPNDLYVNSYGDRLSHTDFADDGDFFALHLSNISKKAKFVPDNNDKEEAGPNYNYCDVENFKS